MGRSKHPKTRLQQLQTGSPYELRLVLALPGQGDRERALHRKLPKKLTRRAGDGGEWFDYEALPYLPDEVYELLDLEMVDHWWVVPKS